MGYKRPNESFTFADLIMKETLEHNPVCVLACAQRASRRKRTGRHSLKTLEKVDKAIHWPRIESILLSHYTVGPVKLHISP